MLISSMWPQAVQVCCMPHFTKLFANFHARFQKRPLPKIGDRVEMTSENSNWEVGECGTVVWVGPDRVAVDFDGRRDGEGYTAFLDAFIRLEIEAE